MTGLDAAFWVLASLAVVSSILVVTHRNPVASVLFLVTSFVAIAGLFVTLHSHFLAAIQVLVYAGAIMVLFLFVVMLLNLGPTPWFETTRTSFKLIALVLGSVFIVILVGDGILSTESLVHLTDIEPRVLGSIEAVGAALYTTYYIPFMAIGLLLLVAMVGAVMLVKRER